MLLKESSIKKIPSRPVDCAWTGIVYAYELYIDKFITSLTNEQDFFIVYIIYKSSYIVYLNLTNEHLFLQKEDKSSTLSPH